MISGLCEDNLEDQPCSICLDENTYEDNEIIFCEKCNVAVHQSCYCVAEIPEGPWFCDVCRAGGDPSTAECRLCSRKGGAYKRTDVPNTWAHSLCMSWIPDAYIELNNKMQHIINCSSVEKSRFKLKCTVCGQPGACIQCAYGRCCTAAHPFCALTTGKFTHRIVKSADVEGAYDWEIFCPTHADAVRDPVKPKNKMKKQIEDNPVEVFEDCGPGSGKGRGGWKPGVENHRGSSGKTTARGSSKPDYAVLNGDLMFSNDDFSDDENGTKPKKKSGRNSRGRASRPSMRMSPVDARPSIAEEDTNAILNLSDWPGQTEGEPLDLQHFWNVVSMMYPEDRSAEATRVMLQPLLDFAEVNPFVEFPPAIGDISDTLTRLANGDEEVLSAVIGTEKERFNAVDEWKMAQLLSSVASVVSSLEGAGQRDVSKETKYTDEDDDDDVVAVSSVRKDDDETTTVYDLTPLEYFVVGQDKALATSDGSRHTFFNEFQSSLQLPCCHREKTICIVYDGCAPHLKRTACVYGVCTAGCPLERDESGNYVDLNNLNAQNIEHLRILPSTTWDDKAACLISKVVTSCGDSTTTACDSARVRLIKRVEVPDDVMLPMGSRAIVSRMDEDEICTFMRRDLKAYRSLQAAIAAKANSVIESEEMKRCHGTRLMSAKEMKSVESKYLNQKVWKWVASSMVKGVRDQRLDFNRHKPDAVPASWTIKVGDRAGIIAAAERAPSEDENDLHEDTVCMVCFDGTSSDGNSIIFCDGCNAPAHQNCYGIKEIPEGDYFCDRCRAVQMLAEEYDDLSEVCVIKDIYKCCLCPLYHGAMKPTTDGRWVHLCCAIWCGANVSILNMEEMGGIDISGVPVAPPEMKDISRNVHTSARVSRMESNELPERPPVQNIEAKHDSVDAGNFPPEQIGVASDFVDSGESSTGNTTTAMLPSESISEIPADAEQIVAEPARPFCAVCHLFTGHLMACCHAGDSSCPKMVHPLCAWFAGYYMRCSLTDPSYMATERIDGLYPAGIEISVFCHLHVPPLDADSLLYRSEQMKIRHQYRISEADLDYVPGMKRRKSSSKKKKKIEAAGPSRVAGGGTNNKDLPIDVFDKTICALCVQPTCPLLEAAGMPSSNAVNSISCNCCGVVVHAACARNTVAAIGNIFCVGSERAPVSVLKVNGAAEMPAESGLVNGASIVVDLTSATDGVLFSEKMDGLSEEGTKTVQAAQSATDIENVVGATYSSAENAACGNMDVVQETPAVSTAEVKTEIGACASGSTLDYLTSLDPLGVFGQSAVANERKSPESVQVLPNGWTCDVCVCRTIGDLGEHEEVRCQLCPRRGGSLVKTQYGRWLHGFCADQLCTVVKDSSPRSPAPTGSVITIKNVPGAKKQNCTVCNRKSGVCVKCSHPECPVLFHPICAQRSGTHYLRIVKGYKEHFCSSHIPEQVYRVVLPQVPNSVYWVNALEIKQLRVYMDKARVILDLIVRRERTRRVMVRSDGDEFEKKYRLMCRRLWVKYRASLIVRSDTSLLVPGEVEKTVCDNAVEEETGTAGGDAATENSADDKGEHAKALSCERIDNDVEEQPDIVDTVDSTHCDRIGDDIEEGGQQAASAVKSESQTMFPDMTDAMKELFDQFVGSNPNASTCDDYDVNVDLDTDDYETYNENVALSLGLMKVKRLAGNVIGRNKRSKSSIGEIFVAEGAIDDDDGSNVSKEVPALTTRKRNRSSDAKADCVVVDNVIFEDQDLPARKVFAGSRLPTAPSYKRDEPKKLSDIKQFEMTNAEGLVTTVDICTSWLTRASRRLSEEEVPHFAKSDAKYMLDMPKLKSIVTIVGGQSYDRSIIGNSLESHSKLVHNDIAISVGWERGNTYLFTNQDDVNAFDSELDGYFDYALTLSEKAIVKELQRQGYIKFTPNGVQNAVTIVAPPKAPDVVAVAATTGRNRRKTDPLLEPELEPKPVEKMSTSSSRGSKQLTLDFVVKKGKVESLKENPVPVVENSNKRKVETLASIPVSSPLPNKKTKKAEFIDKASPSRLSGATSKDVKEVGAGVKSLYTDFGKNNADRDSFSGIIDILISGSEMESIVAAASKQDAGTLRYAFSHPIPMLTPEELVTLERKCSYILSRIEDFKVPVGAAEDPKWIDVQNYLNHVYSAQSGQASKGKQSKRSGGKSKAVSISNDVVELRDIAEVFREFLYEDSPDLRAELGIQRVAPCLGYMRRQLQEHAFNSFWKFEDEFFLMLNSYRRITQQPTIMWDTALLGALFDLCKQECEVPRNENSRLSRTILDISLCADLSKAAPANVVRVECYWCKNAYESENWPVESVTDDCISFCSDGPSDKSTTRRKSKVGVKSEVEKTKCWICKDCLHDNDNGPALVGLPIRVWWTDDAVYYDGFVDAFDTFSHVHRVNYEDGEWEFVDLGSEPYILGLLEKPATSS